MKLSNILNGSCSTECLVGQFPVRYLIVCPLALQLDPETKYKRTPAL